MTSDGHFSFPESQYFKQLGVPTLFFTHVLQSDIEEKKMTSKKGDPLEDSNYRDMVHNG